VQTDGENDKRVVIKYLHIKGMPAQQIYLDMKEVLGDDASSQALSQATVYRWTGALQHGCQSKVLTFLVARLTHVLMKMLILSRI